VEGHLKWEGKNEGVGAMLPRGSHAPKGSRGKVPVGAVGALPQKLTTLFMKICYILLQFDIVIFAFIAYKC